MDIRKKVLKDIQLVMLSGKQQAGKTTAAFYLVDKYNFCHVSFAASLKRISLELFGSMERPYLLKVGAFMRAIDQDVWARMCLQDIYSKAWDLGHKFFVIDDWRFPNELQYLRQYIPIKNILRVRIMRNYNIRRKYPRFSEEALNTPSETALDDRRFSVKIYNNGSKAEFYKQLKGIAEGILGIK